MIIVKISAGLGNQMFQYAFGRVLSIRNEDILKLDITSFKHQSENKYSIRHFSLSPFNIVENIATEKEIYDLKYPFGFFLNIGDGLDQNFLIHCLLNLVRLS